MDIDLTSGGFMMHTHEVAGEHVFLVQPQAFGVIWAKDNLHLRSSVWNAEGDLISASWKKFANFGEKPEVFDVPTSLEGCHAVEKIDGSTLCVSRYKGHLIIRTRGTVDATKMKNGHEIEMIKKKYPKVFDNDFLDDSTVVLEWFSPLNKIILSYGDEPILFLTGIIRHHDYHYESQETLDKYASEWNVPRPRRYNFESLVELQTAVKAFEGLEGICLYFNDDQNITKIKSDSYLFLHRAKSDVASLSKMIDLYFNYADQIGHNPSHDEFFNHINVSFDYEIAVLAQDHITKILSGMEKVETILTGLTSFVSPIKGLSRKEAAERIIAVHGPTGLAPFAFKMLNDRVLTSNEYGKILGKVLDGFLA